MLEGNGKAILVNLLASVVDYTCYHFAHEEQLMERIGYPGYGQHQQEHRELRSRVREMQDRAASGEMTMTIDVAQFLMEWIKHHIIASDRRIGNYMTTRDTKPDPSHSTMTPEPAAVWFVTSRPRLYHTLYFRVIAGIVAGVATRLALSFGRAR